MTTLVFDPSARRLQDGRVLIGAQPARMLRLPRAGAALVDAWRAGAEIGSGDGARRLAERLIAAGLAHPRPDPGAITPADVAVVIPVRDRPGELAACLARVGPCREIVIVDDGSADPSAVAPAAAEPRGERADGAEDGDGARTARGAASPLRAVRVVRRGRSGGPAAARN